MPPVIIGAAISGAAGLAGAAITGSAAKSAASQQAAAENNAAAIQQQQFQETKAGLDPYNTTGQAAATKLQNTAAFDFAPTQANLEQTPGYQFNLSQGLKSTQNSYAAQGLGSSGAALKGAATYASGLADTTYQNQFSNALNSYNTNVSMLQNQVNTGESAAAAIGGYGTQTAQAVGQTAVGAANAGAAGTVGAANAVAGGIGSVGNAALIGTLFNNTNPATAGGGTGIYSGTSSSSNNNLLNPDLNVVS